MAAVRQVSFAAGELSPLLWGRTDLSAFGRGARRLRDFFVSRQGAAVSRPGTVTVLRAKLEGESALLAYGTGLIANTPFTVGDTVYGWNGAEGTVVSIEGTTASGVLKLYPVTGTFMAGDQHVWSAGGSAYATAAPYGAAVMPVRLVPFVYSDTQSYVLEFGHNYIRFHSDGGTVESAPGVPLEVVTAYDADDLAEIQWAQSGDVLTICHPSYPPRNLTRTSHTSWAIADISTARPDGFDTTPGTDAIYLKSPLPAEDIANGLVAREWTWVVTCVRRDGRGGLEESVPATILKSSTAQWPAAGLATLPKTVVVYPSKPVTVWLPAVNLPLGYLTEVVRIYRGRGGVFGWVGDVKSTDEQFTDIGQEPDYTVAPPEGTDPFATDYPAATCYFEDRRGLAGTPLKSSTLQLSATGDYENFDKRLVPIATEALEYQLAARKKEDVRTMVGLDQMLIGTSASVWAFGGSGGEPVAPDVVPRGKVVVEVGCRKLPFLVIGDSALFCRNKGGGVRSLVPGGQNGWQSSDLSVIAQHFFTGTDYDIADWTYAEDPWGIVWCARADGALLSLTYSQADEMWAWAQHNITDGQVRSVCAVPEGNEDALYLAVERSAPDQGGTMMQTMFIERMASRVRYGLTSDDVCVDAAVQYGGVLTTALSGLDDLEGSEVYVIGKDNPVQGPYTVASGAITLDEMPIANNGTGVVLYAGLLYEPELETLDAFAGSARNRQKTTRMVGVEVDQSRGLSLGVDFDNLHEWRQRTVADSYDAVGAATELVRATPSGTWAEHGRIAIRQTLPLPVTLLGVTRDVEVGDG